MIEAAQQALEDEDIESYTCQIQSPWYVVTVIKGGDSGEGRGLSEEEAYENALKAL